MPALSAQALARALVIVGGAALPARTQAATIVVPDDHATIAQAIAVSAEGDSVAVRPGVYQEILTIPHDMSLVGLGGVPVLDGNQDPATVITADGVLFVLADFRITNGLGPCGQFLGFQAGALSAFEGDVELYRVEIVGNGNPACAAGLAQTGGVFARSVIARDCLFQDNVGGAVGSAAALQAGSGDVRDTDFLFQSGPSAAVLTSAAVLERCRFEGNADAIAGSGDIIDCDFVDTGASAADSAASCRFLGGTLDGRTVLTARRITDCVFQGLTGSGSPRPIVAFPGNVGGVLRSRFENNHGFEAAVRIADEQQVTVSGCLLAGSSGPITGGIYLEEGSQAVVESCTFHALSGPTGAALAMESALMSPDLTLERCIVANTTGGPAVHCAGTLTNFTLDCNDFWNNQTAPSCSAGTREFSGDPLFCDAAGGDYGLDGDSPCAAVNAPAGCGLVGAYDVTCVSTGAPVAAAGGAGLRVLSVGPQPSRGGASVRFEMPARAAVELSVHDAAGRRVRRVHGGVRGAGVQVIQWDGRIHSGAPAAAGVYFFRLLAGPESASGKLVRRR